MAHRRRRTLAGRAGRATGLLFFACVAAGACTVITNAAGPARSGNGPPDAASSATSSPAAVKADLVIVNSTLGSQQEQVAGTGIVLTSSGEVITNNHVIEGATSIQAVDIGNGRTYTASVVGYDRSHDVAVLRLHGASGLATAPLAAGSQPSVGGRVTAIGNAGGTGSLSAATGEISALNQSVIASDKTSGSAQQLNGLIQVSADVRPGDSGGPLVNESGRVIGIDTAAGTGAGSRSGTRDAAGFAIPIENALPITGQIDAGQSTGTVHVGPSAQLGVVISGSSHGSGGAAVVAVLPDQAAANAGVQPGDVITSLGGSAVDSPTALALLVDRYHPGQRVTLGWTSGSGQSSTATVTLMPGPAG